MNNATSAILVLQEGETMLTVDEAKALILPGAEIHTIVLGRFIAGCDMPREEVEALIEQASGGVLTSVCGLGHDLAVLHNGRRLYIETDDVRVQALRQQKTSATAG